MQFVLRLLRRFNIFRNLSLTTKMALTTVIMLVGFSLIGAMYFYLYRMNARAEAQQHRLAEFVAINNQVGFHTLSSENALKDFFLSNNEKALKEFGALISEANNDTATLEKLAQNERQQQVIYQLRDAISAFQRAAKQATDTRSKIGLDENLGLQGAMREAGQALTDGVKKLNVPALETSFLTMRGHEKDYLQRATDEKIEHMAQEQTRFQSLLQAANLPADKKAQLDKLRADYHQAFLRTVEGTRAHQAAVTEMNRTQALVEPLIESMNKVTAQADSALRATSQAESQRINQLFIATLLAVGTLVVLSLAALALGMRRSLRQLRTTVQEVADGNLEARVQLHSRDELGQLGVAFDTMLDERVASLARIQQDNMQLNQSVALLLEATAQLSDRDLTVRVPIAEDVTGNIGDALNAMTGEIAGVLSTVTTLASQLETAAGNVRVQGGRVANVATNERQVVEHALTQLEESTRTMADMARLALGCNELASNTGDSTKRALSAVRSTMRSMNDIRTSISETEKGLKRLGERSQEVGGIVEIIKDIAGRTHTLALNAGMQAVAAGEAGRGFSVVADEVQRLAETARESTDQIAALVQSIQAEAAETMATMNKTIDQVVHGSELAENAGKRMRRTQMSTDELVAAVAQIAERSKGQLAITEVLRSQAVELQESTVATEQELQSQNAQTENMFTYLQELVQSVRVFKLPNAA
jgi:twitching motility protein PilJ